DPDVVQPYRNLVDDTYASSGLQDWVEAHDAGVCFFSPLKHGLLLGKYDKTLDFPPGDFRSRIPEFGDPEALARFRAAAADARRRFAGHPEPVLHAVVDSLLTGCANASALLGQRGPRQVEAAASLGEALSPEDAAWVRERYTAGG
ncbi:MAG TPA: hypothetical protein VKU40_12670, partial [Thermoanaerobaculia bacterium]|nr:hypothetical protein [Thermoanaerobaculia bacterium]